MNRILLSIMGFLLLLLLLSGNVSALPPVDQTGNLQPNGNFEEGGSTEWTCTLSQPVLWVYPGWKLRTNGVEPLSCTRLVNDPVIDGNYAAHIKGDRADGIWLYQDQSPGTYTLSAWVYVVTGEALIALCNSDGGCPCDLVTTSSTGVWEYLKITCDLGIRGGPIIYVAGEVYDEQEFYVDGVWYNAGDASTSPFDPSTGFDPNVVPPVSDAGPDQVVFDEVTLDGSASNDPDGEIVSYVWDGDLDEDRTYETNIGNGVAVSLTSEDMELLGLYGKITKIQLTVTDDGGAIRTDTMLLAAAGPCDEWPQPNADFNLKNFNISKFKKWNYTTTTMFGTIELPPDLNLGDGDTVGSRITIELFDALPDGHLVMSDEATLTVRDGKNLLVIKK